MTTTVTNDHTTWYDWNAGGTPNFFGGFASGDGFQTVFKVWNGGSLNALVNNTGISGCGHSKTATSISGHMHAWINCLDIPQTEANGGWAIRITAATTFDANYKSWNCGGIDTSRIAVQRFQPFVCDLDATPDRSAGTVTNASVACVWMEGNMTTSSGQKTTYFDHVYYGTKTQFQGGATAGAAGNSSEASTYATGIPSNVIAVGDFINIGGTYYVLDGLDIGVNNATSQFWEDSNETWVFDGQPSVAYDFYTVTFVGGTGTTHSVKFGIKTGTGVNATGSAGNTFIAGGLQPFNFVISDANLDVAGMYGCNFLNSGNENGTFVLTATNGEVIGCNFASNGQITIGGGATFLRNSVADSVTAATGLEQAAVNLGTTKPTDDTFKFVTISGASRYGLRIEGTSTVGDTWNFEEIVISDSGTADLLVDYPAQTGGNKVTVNLTENSAFSSTTQVAVTGGIALADVVIVADPVTVKVTATTTDGTPIQNALVLLKAILSSPAGPFPVSASVTIARTGSPETLAIVTHTAHGTQSNDKMEFVGADQAEYNGVKTLTYIDVDHYSFPVTGSPLPATPATGTITATYVALYGLTDVNGEISTSRVYASPQDVVGWARKTSSAPFYEEGVLTGSISSTTGYDKSAVMADDE